MKKTIISILILGGFVSGLTNCSDLKFGDGFLEKAPGGDVTVDTIFSSKLYADRALNSAYATLRCGLTMHNPSVNGGSYEHQNAGNKLAWDNLDALTDIINTHCSWGGVYSMYYGGAYDAETENESSGTKMGFNPEQDVTWTGIRKAFLYIENVDRVPDMSEAEKIRRKGEARMVIACQYHELLRHFGGVPLLKTAVEAGKEADIDYSRRTFEETVEYIVALCEQAARELPWTVDPADDGRFTKASALALKIRVLLYAASPLFNANQPYAEPQQPVLGNIGKIAEESVRKVAWYGNYDAQRWNRVVTACEEFITENANNGNPYKLVEATEKTAEGYGKAFGACYADRYNGEILIATGRSKRTYGDTYHAYYFGISTDFNGANAQGYGGGCVTLNYVDKFPFSNGEPAPYAEWIRTHNSTGTVTDNPFSNRDPRLYQSVMVPGGPFRDRVAQMWEGGGSEDLVNYAKDRAATGFCNRKYLWDYNRATFYDKPMNYSYMRLAEVYLAYAEALNETGRKDEACKWLDKTRNRVGLPSMTDELLHRLHRGKVLPSYPECALAGDAELREEILDERAREFAFEEIRWFDIVRWKRADIFRQTLYGIRVTILDGTDSSNFRFNFSEPIPETDRAWKNSFDPKWYLSAFPSNEVNKGYGLTQNAGW